MNLNIQFNNYRMKLKRSVENDQIISFCIVRYFLGDYILLYQQQREQLQKRYQEKDELIRQLTQDRESLQVNISSQRIVVSKSNCCYFSSRKKCWN